MLHLVQRHQFSDSTAEHIVHDHAGDCHEQANRGGFERQAQSDHDRADRDGSGGTHRVKGQHDTQDRTQQSNVRGVRRHRPDDDQALGQGHLTQLLVGELGQVHAAVEQPPLHRDRHRPDAQNQQ